MSTKVCLLPHLHQARRLWVQRQVPHQLRFAAGIVFLRLAPSVMQQICFLANREATRVQEGCSPSFSANNSKHASSESLNSTADAIRKIVRREGVRSLWRGLDTSLMMAIPSVRNLPLPLHLAQSLMSFLQYLPHPLALTLCFPIASYPDASLPDPVLRKKARIHP